MRRFLARGWVRLTHPIVHSWVAVLHRRLFRHPSLKSHRVRLAVNLDRNKSPYRCQIANPFAVPTKLVGSISINQVLILGVRYPQGYHRSKGVLRQMVSIWAVRIGTWLLYQIGYVYFSKTRSHLVNHLLTICLSSLFALLLS